MPLLKLWPRLIDVWRRAAAIPTAIHLLCAEMELRWTTDRTLSAAALVARQRTLDALRVYRRRWEFPRNTATDRFTPCFIDSDGRRCAVAALMEASGHQQLAATVACEANLARIRAMRVPGLEEWTATSGLTPAELARVQPMYPPTAEEVRTFQIFALFVWTLVTVGAATIVLNAARTLRVYPYGRSTALAGVLMGVILFYIGVFADGPQWDTSSRRRMPDTSTPRAAATLVGIVAVFCGVSRLRRERALEEDEEPSEEN